MDRLNGTDLAALHQAILDASSAAFPGVHFEFYRDDRVSLPMGNGVGDNPPMAYGLLELSEMEAGDMDPGTDQQAVTAKFEAHIVMRALTPGAKIAVRALAGAYAAFVRRTLRFDPANVLQGEARVVGAFRDDFNPELDQYEVWRVEWLQDLWLGAGQAVYVIPAEATDSGNPELVPGVPALDERPESRLYSYVPLVGLPYQDEYRELSGVPQVAP